MPFSGTVLNSQVPFGIVPQAADVSFWADGLCSQPPGQPRTLPGGSDLAAYYDVSDASSLIVDGSDRVSVMADKSGNSAENALVLNGVAGNYASAPDSAAVSITGDIELEADMFASLWQPAATSFVLAKDVIGNRSWAFYITTSKQLGFYYTSDGSTFTGRVATSTSDIPFSDFTRGRVKVTYNATSGAVLFYTRNGQGAWVQLGATVTLTAGLIFDSAAQVSIGAYNSGGATSPLSAIVHRAIIRNGIDGPIVFDADFSKPAKGATSFTEDSVNAATVTINSTGDLGARIGGARDLFQATVAKQAVRVPVYPPTGNLLPAVPAINVSMTTFYAIGNTGFSFTSDGSAGSPRCGWVSTINAQKGRQFKITFNVAVDSGALSNNVFVRGVTDVATAIPVRTSNGILVAGANTHVLTCTVADAAMDLQFVTNTGVVVGLTVTDVEISELGASAPYLYFDGVNDLMKAAPFALSQPTTVYFVGEQVTWTNGEYLMDGGDVTSGAILQVGTSPAVRLRAPDSTLAIFFPLGQRGVLVGVYNGALSELRLNKGTPDTNDPGANNMNGFTLAAAGNSAGWGNITVSEILIYAAAHDTATQNRIINYLARKGAITV